MGELSLSSGNETPHYYCSSLLPEYSDATGNQHEKQVHSLFMNDFYHCYTILREQDYRYCCQSHQSHRYGKNGKQG